MTSPSLRLDRPEPPWSYQGSRWKAVLGMGALWASAKDVSYTWDNPWKLALVSVL
jgi:hypothetical protein